MYQTNSPAHVPGQTGDVGQTSFRGSFPSLVAPYYSLALIAVLAVYGFLSFLQAKTTPPWDNEAWFASPALNLIQHGFMGTTILESKGTWMEGMDRHTYWILPLHILAQAAWYKVFGFGLASMRALSIFWGAIVLCSLYVLVAKLSQNRKLALLAVALLAVDSQFTFVSGLGRMEAMCAALGWAGTAAYLTLRERSITSAIFAGNLLVAASCLTHPCGFLYFLTLASFVLHFDRGRIGFYELSLAALPYAVALVAWGAYILQDPIHFRAQFAGNISGIASEFTENSRWAGLKHPLDAFKREAARYLLAYGWHPAASKSEPLKLVPLAFYGLALVVALSTNAVCRITNYRLLIIAGLTLFIVMGLFEGLKAPVYAIHTLPIVAILTAATIAHYRNVSKAWQRWMAFFFVIGFFGVQLAYAEQNSRNHRDRETYEAALRFVENNLSPSSQIIAAGEFAFDLGFGPKLVDDPRLGYYSGKRPDIIIQDELDQMWFKRSEFRDPNVHQYMERLLMTDYREVFRNSGYVIYQRIATAEDQFVK